MGDSKDKYTRPKGRLMQRLKSTLVTPFRKLTHDNTPTSLEAQLEAAIVAEDFALCRDLQKQIKEGRILGRPDVFALSLKEKLEKAKAAEDWSKCAEIQAKIKALPKSRRRRVMERLPHYENHYSSGKDGHPRYYN